MKKQIFTLKRQFVVLVMLCCGLAVSAQQVVVTVNTRDAQTGTAPFSNLEQALIAGGYDTQEKLDAITDLKVITEGTYINGTRETGIALEINDFNFITNGLINLTNLDLSEATVTSNYGLDRGASNSFPNNTLSGNTSVKTIVFPTNLAVSPFGQGSFSNTALEGEITLPANITTLARQVFQGSHGITAFVLDAEGEDNGFFKTVDGVVYSSDAVATGKTLYMYPGGKEDKSYTVEAGTINIFNEQKDLNNPYIENFVINVEAETIITTLYTNATALKSVEVEDGNAKYGSVNGLLVDKATETFMFKIPAGVKFAVVGSDDPNSIGKIIPDYYFNNMKNVEGIEIGASITEIKGTASLNGTSNLKQIIIKNATPPTAAATAFANSPAGMTLGVPAGSESIYINAGVPWITYFSPRIKPYYAITVIDGIAVQSVGIEGFNVTVTANEASEGKVFDKWVATGITLSDENAETTSFIMPANDVTLEATYKNDPTTGIGSTENDNLALYPNPAADYIQLSGANNTSYTIYSVVGRTVAKGVTNGETISVSGLSSGVYIFKADGKAIQFIKK